MQQFFRSGVAFLVVALLCFAAGFSSPHSRIFLSLGGFWIIIAIVVRRKNLTKPPQ
jgi:succinate-acetate transporter protein